MVTIEIKITKDGVLYGTTYTITTQMQSINMPTDVVEECAKRTLDKVLNAIPKV